MMILWFVIIGVLLYLLFNGNINFESKRRNDPNKILDERLARGEIKIEEYREYRKILKEDKR
jgi:uncharacterized membrane protein